LSGIPPAMRGIPQIEVTFDIDANGIVHVGAKDMGTGNEQKITLTASSNLSDDDIESAVREAEQHAEEDKRRKEEVEIRNNADSAVYQTEKTLKDLADKLEEADKAKLESAINDVKEALKGTDTGRIKETNDKLMEAFNEVSQKIYSQNPGAEADPGAQQGPEENTEDAENVYDADYEVVDDEEQE